MLLTIAIPFYNAEIYLELAIKSVLYQTYSHWILLLVDDGSVDNSIEIAKKYELLDSRIKVYSDGKNKNLPYRLNQIAKLTKTKYLARMDADDIMHPERIERQLDILEKNLKIDVLGTNAYSIDENNNILGVRLKLDKDNNELLDTKSFIHPSIMAKTTWFKNNPYDEKALRIEDAELWYRTSSKSCFKVYTEPLLFYREFSSKYYKKYFGGYKSMILFGVDAKDIKWIFKGSLEFLKGSIYYLANKLNFEDNLLKRRSFLITKNELNEGNRLLKKLEN